MPALLPGIAYSHYLRDMQIREVLPVWPDCTGVCVEHKGYPRDVAHKQFYQNGNTVGQIASPAAIKLNCLVGLVGNVTLSVG